jgi:hypothetical protein
MTQQRDWARLGEQRRSGRWWMRCGMGSSDTGAVGGVRGLEELVQASGDGKGAIAGRRAGDAVWGHVRAVGDQVIAASSPQAGRVERQHRTHQDRLSEEVAAKSAVTKQPTCIWRGNICGAQPAVGRMAAKKDWHRRAPAEELDRIFRLRSERVVSNDQVVRYQNRWMQMEGPRAKGRWWCGRAARGHWDRYQAERSGGGRSQSPKPVRRRKAVGKAHQREQAVRPSGCHRRSPWRGGASSNETRR